MTTSAVSKYFMTVVLLSAMSSAALADGRPLSAALSGAEEVPIQGDLDGSGEAFMTLNSGQREICFQLSVQDIAPATAAHIHEGVLGVPGGVVVALIPPTSGFSSACVSADRDLIKTIRQNPENYYVNVHNAEFPGGALRGQLSK
ncbi:MAG: CHRD domain-containing protein [Gammaproteobacteria bacterium]|nr:CHRD domain-containing protein [Gammaproteobacteria bacterium]